MITECSDIYTAPHGEHKGWRYFCRGAGGFGRFNQSPLPHGAPVMHCEGCGKTMGLAPPLTGVDADYIDGVSNGD